MIIPKIIHQIWVGPKKRPDIWMNSVKNFCETQGYQYMLWDDESVKTLSLINQSFYDNEPTYNGKSDILRYEVLYKFGGVYIDADSYIVKPEKFHILLSNFNADAGFGFENDGQLVCGGVSISIVESIFIKSCIDALPHRNMQLFAWQSIGPLLITDMWNRYKFIIPITVYPSKTFYPIKWHGITDIEMHTKIDIPEESVMFQYGYTTNNLEDKI